MSDRVLLCLERKVRKDAGVNDMQRDLREQIGRQQRLCICEARVRLKDSGGYASGE